VSSQWRAAKHAGVSTSVFVQGGPADGELEGVQGVVSRGLGLGPGPSPVPGVPLVLGAETMSSAASGRGLMVRLTDRREVAEQTMAFRLEKPSGWNFTAGQTADLTLVDPPETDGEGNIRTFSMASAPFEDSLMFATRLRDSAFKRVLRSTP